MLPTKDLIQAQLDRAATIARGARARAEMARSLADREAQSAHTGGRFDGAQSAAERAIKAEEAATIAEAVVHALSAQLNDTRRAKNAI